MNNIETEMDTFPISSSEQLRLNVFSKIGSKQQLHLWMRSSFGSSLGMRISVASLLNNFVEY